jgi:prepilin-type N-terminal cleavage/methylation domain-containing protein
MRDWGWAVRAWGRERGEGAGGICPAPCPAPRDPLPSPRASGRATAAPGRRGVSLMEVMLVAVIIGILISMSAPSFHRGIEQSWADIAGANLRAIWSAQRLYWLENRTYTGDLSELESLGLLDPTIVSGTSRYVYAISAADGTGFRATATRIGSLRWTGQLAIDESGILSGAIQAVGEPSIVPGFQ